MKENKIPTTAKEFFEMYKTLYHFEETEPEYLMDKEDFLLAMNEFAKLHVAEALKQASERVILNIDVITEKANGQFYVVCDGNHYSETKIRIDKDSILTAYSL